MRTVLLAAMCAACAACATTASVCPLGTKRVDVQHRDGFAQWCSATDQRLQALPVRGRSYEGVLGTEPKPMRGGVRGPYTTWYANGNVESHGHYIDADGRSVADGVWAFWYPAGPRRMVGRYVRGEPTGCFALWDELGTRRTGIIEGDALRVVACTPPSDDELAADLATVTARAPIEPRSEFADISLQGFSGPGGIGARNMLQTDTDPSLQLAVTVAGRARFGRLRVGPHGGVRISEDTDYRAFSFGGVLGVALPTFHRRFDTEASLEIGGQYITAVARRPMVLRSAHLGFWSPLGAVQLSGAFKLSPSVEVVAALRVDGTPTRDVHRDVTYCGAMDCLPPQQETWSIGGFAYGLNLGVRLVLR